MKPISERIEYEANKYLGTLDDKYNPIQQANMTYIIAEESFIAGANFVRGIMEQEHELLKHAADAEAGEVNRLNAENEKLKKDLVSAQTLIEKMDQYLCERIIDPCGYDPNNESYDALVGKVVYQSEENEKMLNYIRAAIRESESKLTTKGGKP